MILSGDADKVTKIGSAGQIQRTMNRVEFETIKGKDFNEQGYLCCSCVMYSFTSKNTFKGLFIDVLLPHSYHLGLLDLHCIEPVPFKDKVVFY